MKQKVKIHLNPNGTGSVEIDGVEIAGVVSALTLKSKPLDIPVLQLTVLPAEGLDLTIDEAEVKCVDGTFEAWWDKRFPDGFAVDSSYLREAFEAGKAAASAQHQ